MNIAILVAGLPPDRVGGAELQAALLASRLATRHCVRIWTRTKSIPLELASQPCCQVIRRSAVDVGGLRFAADLAGTLLRIARGRKNIDVILAYQTVIDGLIGVLAKMFFGIPVIVSVRCDSEYQMDKYLQSRLFAPFVFHHADRVAVQSLALRDDLLRTFDQAGRHARADELRSKLFVLPNGIEPAVPREGDGEGVLYVGRLTKPKSVDVLLAAMKECPGQRLTIVGDGPERTALERAARSLPNVSFVGMVAREEVPRYLARARMLVLPSREEGQPNIVMQAMALGVPVIATRVGGVPDLITDGESGWLVEPGDAAALAHAISRIAHDARLRGRLTANGIKKMQGYDWTAVVRVIEEQFGQLTGVEPKDPPVAQNRP